MNKDVTHKLSRESRTFLNSYARHAMYPASFIMSPRALMAHRAIAQFGSAPALGAGCSQNVALATPDKPYSRLGFRTSTKTEK